MSYSTQDSVKMAETQSLCGNFPGGPVESQSPPAVQGMRGHLWMGELRSHMWYSATTPGRYWKLSHDALLKPLGHY